MRRAFPGSEYYDGSAPSRPGQRSVRPAIPPGWRPGRWQDPDGSRVHCDSLDGGGARLCPCGITTATPQHFAVVSRPAVLSGPGVTHRFRWARTAPGPYPPDSSRCKMKGRKRRFLSYSFPSCSPDPHHLAVLARSGFVRAASCPPRHHPAQAALSSTVLLRQDRRRRSLTSVRINSASRRTGRSLRTMTRIPAGQEERSSRPVMLGDPGPGRDLPAGVIGGFPDPVREGEDGLLHVLGDGHADRVVQAAGTGWSQ